MAFEFLRLLQKRIANTSIAPSTARGMGPAGTIRSAREYLSEISLGDFSVASEKEFQDCLNRHTSALRRRLPAGGTHWGSSRKFLNIFLRGSVYNRYLCREYKLKHIEPWLELPMDSHVATGLRQEHGGDSLPRWRSVIGLSQGQNRAYQDFASEVAERHGTLRVHLDLLYWRNAT